MELSTHTSAPAACAICRRSRTAQRGHAQQEGGQQQKRERNTPRRMQHLENRQCLCTPCSAACERVGRCGSACRGLVAPTAHDTQLERQHAQHAHLADGLDVTDLHARVGGRLQHDQPRAALHNGAAHRPVDVQSSTVQGRQRSACGSPAARTWQHVSTCAALHV